MQIFVAMHPAFGAPVFQEPVALGIVKTTCPFAGQVDHGVTNDFGELVAMVWGQLAAALTGGAV